MVSKVHIDLECDICGSPMRMTKYDTGVSFDCIKEDCQYWSFDQRGSSCKILKSLWPSNMDENSTFFRNEYLPSWLAEREFHAKASFLAGFMTEGERDDFLEKVHGTLAKWYDEHPQKADLSKRLWPRFCSKVDRILGKGEG